MSHPPIPPKSRYFKECCALRSNFGKMCFQNEIGFEWCIDSLSSENEFESHDKGIVAACAEVEWRKRSDRWLVVRNAFSRIRYKWSGENHWNFIGAESEKVHWVIHEIQRCGEIADQWRKWGSEK